MKNRSSTTSTKFTPHKNRVLFERVKKPQPKGVVATIVEDIPLECRVLAVGPKCEHVKPGMTVLIPRSEGMTMQGVSGLLCYETSILAIVK